MNQERKQVLDMLAEGKISVGDAERLLDKLGVTRPAGLDGETDRSGSLGTETMAGLEAPHPGKLKYLRVLVDSNDGDKVNIRVPLALVRTGIKLTAVMPEHAQAQLSQKGIDLSNFGPLEGDELIEALRELNVNVDSADGDTVRIFCE